MKTENIPYRTKATRVIKHPAFEWSLWLGIPLVLYLTGLHTEVLGGMQRVILATGLVQADTQAKQEVDASYNIQLRSLDGQLTSLRELKGKVIFLNVWATWCPPCVAEMPGIQKLYDQVKSEDIVFVMISVDDNLAKVQKFIQRKEYTFPVYQLADGSIPSVYASPSIPTTFVISPEGKIVMRHEGMADYNSEKFKTYLQSLVKK